VIEMSKIKNVMVGFLVLLIGLMSLGAVSATVLINEFVPTPSSGNDKIELYSDTGQDLTGWILEDSTSKIADLSGIMGADSYLEVEVSNRLDATGDTIKLIDSSSTTIDEVTYGTGASDAPVASTGETAGRYPNAVDTGIDSDDFIIFSSTSSTIGTVNIDSDVPVITIVSPTDAIYTTSSILLDATAVDNVGVDTSTWEFDLDSLGRTPFTPGSTYLAFTSDGAHSIVFYVKDAATPANEGTAVQNFTVALTKTIEITVASISETKNAEEAEFDLEGTFTINNTGESPLEGISLAIDNLTLSYDSDETIDVSDASFIIKDDTGTTINTLAKGEDGTVSFSITVPRHNDIDFFGTYSGTITVTTTEGATDTATLNLLLNPKDFNEDISIDKVDIGDDDLFRLGTTDITVTIKNDLSKDDIEDVTVYLEIPELDISEKEKIEDISNDDEEDVVFDIEIPDDAPSGTYTVRVYVDGEDEDRVDMTNYDNSEDMTVSVDSNHLKIVSVTPALSEVNCGQSTTVDVEVTNIGSGREKDLKLELSNSDLGISQSKTISELKSKKSNTFSFIVEIPDGKSSGEYLLATSLVYSDDDDQDEDDDLSRTGSIVVTCGTTPTVLTSAGTASSSTTAISGTELKSGEVGEPVKYDLTLSNSGTETSSYTIEVIGISDWASVNIEPSSEVRLASGEDTTIFVYLTPDLGSSGSNSATVNVKSGGITVASKVLSTTVASDGLKITTFTSSTLSEIGTGTSLLYSSVVLNFVLLVGMIAVFYSNKINKKPKSKTKYNSIESRSWK